VAAAALPVQLQSESALRAKQLGRAQTALDVPGCSSRSSPERSTAHLDMNAGVVSAQPSKAVYPFRCQDRSSIPNELVEGPFEELEIAGDVYSTAYLIARNATPDLYSISPWKNSQVRIVWLTFLSIVLSQCFVIVAITLLYPPTVGGDTDYVNCDLQADLERLFRLDVIKSIDADECKEVGFFAFVADVRGKEATYYKIEASSPFYDQILIDGDWIVIGLRFICCTWVFSQMYLQHFENVRSLLRYHDFSCWFLPLKESQAQNGWVIVIPVLQYAIIFVVTTVSFLMICAQKEPFDIVMNSLAFGFIAEVGSYFNEFLSKHLADLAISPEVLGDMRYLYPEYDESNAVEADGKYTDGGWYICEEEQKAGLLSDYKIRHNPSKYDHPTEGLLRILDRLLCYAPVLLVAIGAVRSAWLWRSRLAGLAWNETATTEL